MPRSWADQRAGHALQDGAGQFGGGAILFSLPKMKNTFIPPSSSRWRRRGVGPWKMTCSQPCFALGLRDHGCVVTAALCHPVPPACAGVGGGEPDVHGFGGAEVVTCGRANTWYCTCVR